MALLTTHRGEGEAIADARIRLEMVPTRSERRAPGTPLWLVLAVVNEGETRGAASLGSVAGSPA
jgi:hypothetical protein